MLKLARLLVLASLLLPVFPAAAEEAGAESESKLDLVELVRQNARLELDTSRSADVSNYEIEVEALKLTLESGSVFFAKPLAEGERPRAMFFLGKGHMRYRPPTETNRYMLNEKIGKEMVEAPFTNLFVAFSGDHLLDLQEKLGPATRGASSAESGFKSRRAAINSIPIASAGAMGMPPRPEWGDLFAASMDVRGYGWVWYVRDPNQPKENIVWRELSLGLGQTYFDSMNAENFWGQFDDQADLDKIARGEMDPGHESKDRIQMDHVEMDLTVAKGSLRIKQSTKITFTTLYDDDELTYFEYIWDPEGDHDRIVVESIKEDGEELPFVHERNILLIGLSRPTKAGEKRTLEFEHWADNVVRPITLLGPAPPGVNLPTNLDWLDQEAQTYTLLNTYPWFPQHGFLQRYSLDWEICAPKPIVPVASGTTEKEWSEEGYNCIHSVEKEKVALASILLGHFESYVDDSKRPTIRVHTLKKQKKDLKGKAETTRNVIDAYEERLGPFPYDELDIGQMGFFFGFGQAPPGLVQLTGEAFVSDGDLAEFGYDPTFKWAFLAHEIGHEWFGHVVSWASPEDQWLSESFTEYISGLYVKNLQGFGDGAFETKKREWRERADLSNHKAPIEAGQWAGGFHYQNLAYYKGPYVVQMFHQALLAEFGPEEGNDMFFAVLREFMAKHRHQNATTRDLQVSVKETTGRDMDWFFDQWFRGVGVPDLKWAYDIRPTEDGAFLVEGTLEQINDTGEVKSVLVPIYLHYKDRTIPVYRVTWDQKMGPMKVYPVKLKVAERPERVTIDDFDTLLGKVEVVQ
jgi:hypothetical protein